MGQEAAECGHSAACRGAAATTVGYNYNYGASYKL